MIVQAPRQQPWRADELFSRYGISQSPGGFADVIGNVVMMRAATSTTARSKAGLENKAG
jgi:hypothetical protein